MDLLKLDNTNYRENVYSANMGKLLGAFGTAVVKMDAFAKDAALARTIRILGRPNVSWGAGGTILGSDEKLVAGGTVPAVVVSDMRVFAPSKARISGSMRTSESNKAKQEDSHGGSFSVGFGGGLFGLNGSVRGQMSSKTTQTRATDYSAKCDWSVEFDQGPPPEGVAMICETSQKIIDTLNQINIARANAKAQEIADTASDSPQLPDPDDDGGSDDGSDDDDASGTDADGGDDNGNDDTPQG